MKKLLLLLLFTPCLGFSQDKAFIQSIWGITFGSSTIAAKQVASSKGAQVNDAVSTTQSLIFTKILFAEQKVDTIQLNFYRDKLWQGIVKYPDFPKLKVMDQYQNLIKDLSNVYGKAELYVKFLDPYVQGRDEPVSAIEGGYAEFRATWRVPNTPDGNTIELHITKDLRFILTYTDGGLKKLVDAQNMKIKSRDY